MRQLEKLQVETMVSVVLIWPGILYAGAWTGHASDWAKWYILVCTRPVHTCTLNTIWNHDRLYEIMVFGTYRYVPVCTVTDIT